MQTWLVHMRRPRRLIRDLNPAGAFTFQLLLAGNVLSALIHPIFMAVLCYMLLAEPSLRAVGAMGAATLLCGYASTIVLDAIGLKSPWALAPRLGAHSDAAVLVFALACRVARADSALARSAALGKDRARPSPNVAHAGNALTRDRRPAGKPRRAPAPWLPCDAALAPTGDHCRSSRAARIVADCAYRPARPTNGESTTWLGLK